ncbi:MAG TPA: TPM domain-containing protein [Planctomycetota bacterium]|nr:TPM domain-containing protein [Planctomycetota bacterium]
MRTIGALLAVLLATSPAFAQGRSFVEDRASILSPSELAAIESRVQSYAAREHVQLAVLTLADAGTTDPKAIAVATLNEWNAGQRSVLLLICMNPHEVFIQPGTQLASTFDEATASAICRDEVGRRLRAGMRGGAIEAGLDAIEARLKEPPRASQQGHPMGPLDFVCCCGGLSVPLLLVGVVVFSITYGTYKLFRGHRCESCDRRIPRGSPVTVEREPTLTYPGLSYISYTCVCGFSGRIARNIPSLGGTGSDGSSYDWGSGGGGSDSGPSSDGGGGGGSSW